MFKHSCELFALPRIWQISVNVTTRSWLIKVPVQFLFLMFNSLAEVSGVRGIVTPGMGDFLQDDFCKVTLVRGKVLHCCDSSKAFLAQGSRGYLTREVTGACRKSPYTLDPAAQKMPQKVYPIT